MPHDLPRVTSHNNMNSNNFFAQFVAVSIPTEAPPAPSPAKLSYFATSTLPPMLPPILWSTTATALPPVSTPVVLLPAQQAPKPSFLLSKPSTIIVIKPTLLHAHHHQQTYCLHKTPPHPLLSLSLNNFSTVFHHPIPPTIGNMASTLSTRSITTNPRTSALHGNTLSALGTSQHFPTFKLPSSKPLSKPLLLATQLTALHLSGGYCFTSTCLSLHHLQKNNATTFPLAIPSMTA
jgi:hypothetical protein